MSTQENIRSLHLSMCALFLLFLFRLIRRVQHLSQTRHIAIVDGDQCRHRTWPCNMEQSLHVSCTGQDFLRKLYELRVFKDSLSISVCGDINPAYHLEVQWSKRSASFRKHENSEGSETWPTETSSKKAPILVVLLKTISKFGANFIKFRENWNFETTVCSKHFVFLFL